MRRKLLHSVVAVSDAHSSILGRIISQMCVLACLGDTFNLSSQYSCCGKVDSLIPSVLFLSCFSLLLFAFSQLSVSPFYKVCVSECV